MVQNEFELFWIFGTVLFFEFLMHTDFNILKYIKKKLIY